MRERTAASTRKRTRGSPTSSPPPMVPSARVCSPRESEPWLRRGEHHDVHALREALIELAAAALSYADAVAPLEPAKHRAA